MKLNKNKEINKLLVIRLSSMGDIILSTPIVRVLRNTYPSSEIDFLTSSYFTEIYKFNPFLNKIIQYDKSKSIKENQNLKLEHNRNNYDLIIDLQNNRRSHALTSGLKSVILRVNKQRLHKLSLVYFKRPLIANYSVVKNYFDVLRPLGINPDENGLEIWNQIDFEEEGYLKHPILKTNSIAFAPSANHFTKRWPSERFAILAKTLMEEHNSNVVLIGGKKDKELCNAINLSAGGGLLDKSGSESVLETAKILDSCIVLVTNDTGVMHIAAARKIPVIAIFGSSVKELGFLPYKTNYEIVEKDLECRPCSHIGRKSCPKNHFNCMNLIEYEEVLKEILKFN